MLNFRSSSLLFVVLILLLLLADLYLTIPVVLYFIVVLAYLVLIAIGSSKVSSGFFMSVICKGSTGLNAVSLTFDDGPDPERTPAILEVLRSNQINAAFFCIGRKISGNEELIHRIDREGHILANHSYSHHFFFDFFPAGRIAGELEQTNKIISELIQKKPAFFRPPYGVTTPHIAKAVKFGNFVTIGWNRRSLDTVMKTTNGLLKRTTSGIKAGDIILLHDTSDLTVSSLQELINRIRECGLSIVRLDQLINKSAYV
jgi:peptidoglycan/xylan/chitin deacetylase (PgdA/CDA1 family)